MHGSAGFHEMALHRGWWPLSLNIWTPMLLCQITTLPSGIDDVSTASRGGCRGGKRRTFAATDDEALVGTAEGAPDKIFAARVSRVLPDEVARGEYAIQEDLAVLLVHEDEARVGTDAHRRGARLQRQVVFQLPSDEVVNMEELPVVHGDEPLAVGRQSQVFGPVLLGPRVNPVAVQVPLAQRSVLVEGT